MLNEEMLENRQIQQSQYLKMAKKQTQISQNSVLSLSFQGIFDSLLSFLPHLYRSPIKVLNFTLMCFNELTQISLFVVLIGQTAHVLHSDQKRFINVRHLLIKWIIYVILVRLVQQIKHHTIFDQLFILVCNAFAFVLVFPSKFIKNVHLTYFSCSDKKQFEEGMGDPALMEQNLPTRILTSLSIICLDLSRFFMTFVPLNQRRKIQESLKEVNLTIVEQKYFGKSHGSKWRKSSQLSQLVQPQGVIPSGQNNVSKSQRSSKAAKPQKNNNDNSIKMRVKEHIEINLGSVTNSENGNGISTFYRNIQIAYNVQTIELAITDDEDKRTTTLPLLEIVIIDDQMLQFIFEGEENYPMFVMFKSKKDMELFINYIYLESSQNIYSMESRIKSSSLEKQSGNLLENNAKQTRQQQDKQPAPTKKGRITLGVCAMKKKVQSKPMRQILSRLVCKQIQIIEMWQCLEHHWSLWPKVDAMICFYSEGFPYLMAWKYVKLHKPFLINSLDKQQLLWDRTVVYDILKKLKVPVAKHYYVFKDSNYIDELQAKGFGNIAPDPLDLSIPRHFNCKIRSMESSDDQYVSPRPKTRPNYRHLLVSDPLLILPISSHKHQNHRNLRKINEQRESGNRQNASKQSPPESTNKNAWKYADFQDIQQEKDYPTLLRRFVERRKNHLKNYEIEEGDDFILIKNGSQVKRLKKPFVEKPFDSQKHQICVYYPQSMGGGRKKLFRKIKDQSSQFQNLNQIRNDSNYIYQQFLPTNAFDIKVYTIGSYYMYAEARRSPTLDGVVQRNQQGKQVRYPVILSPDQKFICNKIVQQFQQQVCGFDLLRANGKSYVCDVNGWSFVKGNPKYWDDCAFILKKKILNKFLPGGDSELLFIERKSKTEGQQHISRPIANPKVEELRSIVSIFRHGDRSPKLKLKIKTKDKRFLQFFKDTDKDQLKFKDGLNLSKFLNIAINIIAELDQNDPVLKDYLQMKIVLQSRGHFDGLTRKLQLKVAQRSGQTQQGKKGAVKKVLIVLKWGGQLSYMGYLDAIDLGEKMRKQRYDNHDCLSLYSSYRHDVKTYASDEGRCIKTAAAFLKGFLSIEGELAPIISSMVMADSKAQRLLDCTSSQNHSTLADELQERLTQMLNSEQELMTNYQRYRGNTVISQAMKKVILKIGRPRKLLGELHECLKQLSQEIKRVYDQNWQDQYLNERKSHHEQLVDEQKCQDLIMIDSRWVKLKKELFDSETQKFNISKVPDIYDTIRHDLRKNSPIFKKINQRIIDNVYEKARTLAHFVVINEYGINDEQRLRIAQDICLPLIEKMKVDLMFWRQKSSQDLLWKYRNNAQIDNWRHIRTRLYFTSASHMYSLLNILVLGENKLLLQKTSKEQVDKITNILYMGYLSHIQFRLYENLTIEDSDPNRFRLEISLSTEYKQNKQMKEFSFGGSHGFTVNQINQFFKVLLNSKGTDKQSSNPSSQRKMSIQ